MKKSNVVLICCMTAALFLAWLAVYLKILSVKAEQPVVEKKEPVAAIKTEVIPVSAYATYLIKFKVEGVEYLIWRGQNDILLSKKVILEYENSIPEASKVY